MIRQFYLFVLSVSVCVAAQTIEPPASRQLAEPVTPSQTNQAQAPSIEILADDGVEYDSTKGTAVYKGNVRVYDPQIKLTCEWLIVNDLSPETGVLGDIIAETNVVIEYKDKDGFKIAKGQKAVYSATNNTVALSGSPTIESPVGKLWSNDRIIFDRARNKFWATGNTRMIYWGSITNLSAPSAVETNALKEVLQPPAPAATNIVDIGMDEPNPAVTNAPVERPKPPMEEPPAFVSPKNR